MSFSKAFRVDPRDATTNLIDQRELLLREQRGIDESYSIVRHGVVEGHQAQVRAGFEALATLTEQFPDAVLEGSLAGHANEDGSGSVNVVYRITKA